MKKIAAILLLFLGFVGSTTIYSQGVSNKDLVGVYFGKVRAEGSMSGKDIAIRFYENGDVICMALSKKPAYVETFIKSFNRKNSSKISSGTFELKDKKVKFKLMLTLKGKRDDFNFEGRVSASKKRTVILFRLYSKFKNMGYRLYAERVWSPSDGGGDENFIAPVVVNNVEEASSVVKNNNKIKDELNAFQNNLKEGNLEGATKNLNNIGLSHFGNKDYEDAINSFNEALLYSEMTGDQKAAADIRNNLGVSHERLNQRKAALKSFEQAAKEYKELGDYENAAKVVFQISLLEKNHLDKKAEEEALEDLVEIEKSFDKKQELSATYNLLVINLMKQNKSQEAQEYLDKAFNIDRSSDDKAYEAVSINNLGNIQLEQGDVKQAISSYRKSLEIKETMDDIGSQAITFHNLGNAFFTIGELKSAEDNLRKSLLLAKEAREAKTINANYRALANLLADANSCKDPLENYKNYISGRFQVLESKVIKPLYEEKAKYLDSDINADGSLADDIAKLGIGNDDLISINMLQEDLRRTKKESEQEIKEAQNQIKIQNKDIALLESQQEAEKEKTKTLTWMVIGAAVSGVLVLSLLVLAIRSKNRTKKDKQKIEDQKDIIEEKNKEFTDSVTYASRLQTAILPPDSVLSAQLKEYFVLYRPKDIVAGDFYWTETIGDYTYVAAADCTGHGVPGAMVSVVCSNSLFRAVNEFGLRDTGAILNKTRELVIQTFEKSTEVVKDGMDIALIRLDKKSSEIQYTGAHNSLLISRDRNGADVQDRSVFNEEKVLIEHKADKQPVGQYAYAKDFSTNKIRMNEGDQLFLFSDGYADQFGGEKGKKMKVRFLKELLLDLSSLPIDQQKKKLEQSFLKWKGDLEQVDDVCVIGLRF